MSNFWGAEQQKIKSKVEIAVFTLPPSMALSLIVIQLCNLLTLSTELAGWFIALASLCFIWHSAIYFKVVKKPSRLLKLLIATVGCFLLLLSGKELGLLLSMLHLLCFAYLLKPFELNSRKDFYELVILGFIVLATSLIFQYSIYFAMMIVVMAIINITWLLCWFSESKRLVSQLGFASKLIFQSLPLAIILFVVFPKIPPFWQMPAASSATTGLSDNVTIGDIAHLARSNELAFRVEFDGVAPTYEQMYWRTLVLDTFDGTHWRKKKTSSRQAGVPRKFSMLVKNEILFNKNEQGVGYQVIAEPSYQHWLFALDIVKLESVKHNKRVYQLLDHTLYSQDKISQLFSYQVTSYLQSPLNLLMPEDKKNQYKKVDVLSNSDLRVYAAELRANFQHDDSAIIQAVLSRFSKQNYRYTLSPPALNNNSLDQFFFSTKAGFCEHYASSFTFLMRAAGIPARLVLGYLGGEYNQQGNYYSIYQRDAHAWSEVWLQGQGWVRIDPTSAVDPSRVEQGFSEQLLSEQQAFSSGFSQLGSVAWLSQIRMQLDALDYQWTKLVINYSQDKQNKLMKDWLGDQANIKSAIIIALSLVFMAASIWFAQKFKRRKTKPVVWLSYLQQAERYLACLGLVRNNIDSTVQFCQQVGDYNNKLGILYRNILDGFEQLQYKKESAEQTPQQIENQKQQIVNLMKQQLQQLKKIK